MINLILFYKYEVNVNFTAGRHIYRRKLNDYYLKEIDLIEERGAIKCMKSVSSWIL